MSRNSFSTNLQLLQVGETKLPTAIADFSSLQQAELSGATFSVNSTKSKKTFFKKQAPLIALFLVAVGFFVLGVFLLSPSLLLIHITQSIVDKFDTQQVSAEARSNLLLDGKWLDNQAESEYRIINSYRQIPENLVKNLEAQGFSIETKNKQISAVFFKQQAISRQDFLNKLRTDFEIIEAKNNSYNSKRVLFQDLAWQKNASNLRLSKNGFSEPANGEEANQSFKQQEYEIIKITEPEMRFDTTVPTETDQDGNQTEQSSPSIELFKSLRGNLEYINQQADKASNAKESPFNKSFNNLKLVESNFVNNQSACGLYNNGIFLQNYAKTEQAGQQSRLAFNLFIESEKIKAGLATPESAEFYGKRLTETFTTTKQNGTIVETKAATDSIGYKYLAYGDTPELDENAERYVIGASPSVAKTLKAVESATDQCGNSQDSFLKSFFANFFSNIANLLNPFRLNLDFINQLLDSGKDRQLTENTVAAMANLKVAPNTAGEDLLNSTVAASGHLFGRLAAIGGNNVLTKTQAMAYFNEQEKYLALQGKIEAKNLSPLDPNSKYTLVGSIIHNNLHLFNQSASIRSFSQSILKSFRLALAKLNPVTQAKNVAVNHNRCQDPALLKLNQYLNGEEVALDIACNPIYGVDVEALNNITPIQVIERLIASGDLVKVDPTCNKDCELELASGLAKYQKNCINRAKLPIGDANADEEFDDGESCLANSEQKTLYALYFIDNRLETIFNQIPVISE